MADCPKMKIVSRFYIRAGSYGTEVLQDDVGKIEKEFSDIRM